MILGRLAAVTGEAMRLRSWIVFSLTVAASIPPPTAPAQAQRHMDAYHAAAAYRDTIAHAAAMYRLAGAAWSCRLRDYPTMFRLQMKIQVGMQENIKNYSKFTDDKANFENLAWTLFHEEAEKMSAFDAAIASSGVSASDCLDLRSSEVLQKLDALAKEGR